MFLFNFFSRRSLILLCILLFLSTAASLFLVQRKFEIEQSRIEMIILNQSTKITNVLSKLLYKTQALSSLIIQNNGEIVNFEKAALAIVDDPAILNVLLAPNGIVQDVYPREGNEAVLGLDFFSEGAGNKEAMQAKETREMVLGGPFPLVQGGEAIVGRLPIYLPQEDGTEYFWGLVSVTLKFPQALDGAELNSLSERGLGYEIWRINPDTNQRQVIAASPFFNANTPYIEVPLQILNAEWTFCVSPIKFWYQYLESWVYIFIGVIGSLLITALIQHAQDLGSIRHQLEEIVNKDPLTGLLNRRGLFETLTGLVDANKPFYLFFFDLNDFKYINDTFGHAVGDNVLLHFTKEVLLRTQDFSYAFGRIGGDEFILLIQGEVTDEEIDKNFHEIHQSLQATKLVNDDTFKISFSMGIAHYPHDGHNIDELIHIADKKMYADKEQYKIIKGSAKRKE